MKNCEKQHFKTAFGIDYPVDGTMYCTFSKKTKVCIVLSAHRTGEYADSGYIMACSATGSLVVDSWDILMDGRVQTMNHSNLVPV